MTNRSRVLTATLLIVVPVLFMLFYGLLTMTFDYPGILREPAGFALAGTINAVAYLAWSLWLVATGVSLLRARPEVASDPAPTVAASVPLPVAARP